MLKWWVSGVLGLGLLVAAAAVPARAAEDTAQAAATAGVLDGKTFIGEVGDQGKAKGDKDEFLFQAGKFRSTACDKYGFSDAAYTTRREGGALTFSAETISSKEGKMVWNGTIRGNTVEGTALWQKAEGKTPQAMWFKGSLKQ